MAGLIHCVNDVGYFCRRLIAPMDGLIYCVNHVRYFCRRLIAPMDGLIHCVNHVGYFCRRLIAPTDGLIHCVNHVRYFCRRLIAPMVGLIHYTLMNQKNGWMPSCELMYLRFQAYRFERAVQTQIRLEQSDQVPHCLLIQLSVPATC